MAIFAITTSMTTRSGDPIWFPFECDEFEDTDELYDHLVSKEGRGIALGDRLKVRKDNSGYYHEIERDRIILGTRLIGMITLMNPDKFVESVGYADSR